MPIDAMIPLMGKPMNVMSPFQVEAGAQQIQAGQNQNALASMQIQQKQQEVQTQNAMLQLAQQPGMRDEKGMPTVQYVNALGKINPQAAMTVAKNLSEMRHQEAQTAELGSRAGKEQIDRALKENQLGREGLSDAYGVYTSVKQSSGGGPDAEEIATRRMNERLKETYDQHEKSAAISNMQPFRLLTPQEVQWNMMSADEHAKVLMKQQEEMGKLSHPIPVDDKLVTMQKQPTGEWKPTYTAPNPALMRAQAAQTSAGASGEGGKPLTDLAKLNADLKAGRITQEQFDKASVKKGGASTVQEKMNPVMLASVLLDMKEVDYGLEEIGKLSAQTSSPFFEDAHGGNFAMRMLKKYGTPDERQQYDTLANRFSQAIASMQAMGRGQITDARIAEAKKLVPVPGDTKANVRTKLAAIRKIRDLTEETLKTKIKDTRTTEDEQQDVNDFSSLWK